MNKIDQADIVDWANLESGSLMHSLEYCLEIELTERDWIRLQRHYWCLRHISLKERQEERTKLMRHLTNTKSLLFVHLNKYLFEGRW